MKKTLLGSALVFVLAFGLMTALLLSLAPGLHAQAASGDATGIDLSNSGSGYCPTADRLVQLPAVVGGAEGGLIDLDVSVAPGNGSVFSTVYPLVGVSTQQSEQQAVEEAFAGLPVNPADCDVAFALEQDAGGTGSVDGPSAGVAMTVALRAALTGVPIRKDVIITGRTRETDPSMRASRNGLPRRRSSRTRSTSSTPL